VVRAVPESYLFPVFADCGYPDCLLLFLGVGKSLLADAYEDPILDSDHVLDIRRDFFLGNAITDARI